MILVELELKDVTPVHYVFKRKWKHCCPETLKQKLKDSLESVNFGWHDLNVQEHWNQLENLTINVADELAPLTPFDENAHPKNKKVPPHAKNKINLRKRLLMLEKKEILFNKPHVLRSWVNQLEITLQMIKLAEFAMQQWELR